MIELTVQPVAKDGALGAVLGTARMAGQRVVYAGSSVIENVIDTVARRSGAAESQVFGRLADEGWSNGKIVIHRRPHDA